MFVLQAHFVSQNKIGTNICFTLNLLGHHFDYDHHFIMVFILRPFFHKLGSQQDLQRISFMPPISESWIALRIPKIIIPYNILYFNGVLGMTQYV